VRNSLVSNEDEQAGLDRDGEGNSAVFGAGRDAKSGRGFFFLTRDLEKFRLVMSA